VKPSLSFDRIAEQYDETRGGFVVGRSFADAIQATIPPAPARIVEFGVGTGLVALPMTERGYDVLGVDLSPKMIAVARERIGARVAVADVSRAPLATECCDVVVAARVLHVVGDPGAALTEAARILRPGGRMVAILAGSDQEAPADDISDATRDMHGQRLSGADLEMIISLAGATDLDLVARGFTGMLEFDETPREHAEKLRARTWSGCWDIDDETWARTAEPVIEGLLALPDPDRPRRRRRAQRLGVFARR